MKKTSKKLNKAVKIIAKIFEIVHWAGIGIMIAMAICAVAATEWLTSNLDIGNNTHMSFYGYEVSFVNSVGGVETKALLMFAIGAAAICPLMAMIFRNIYLIFKLSESSTPFCKDNIRMVKEMGIFSIAIPVVGLIMGIITGFVIGLVKVEHVSVNATGIIIGLIALAMTQFFVHGAELEQDTDGLV